MPFIFRNWVRKGDIVIVSKGNSLFRAISEVTGEPLAKQLRRAAFLPE